MKFYINRNLLIVDESIMMNICEVYLSNFENFKSNLNKRFTFEVYHVFGKKGDPVRVVFLHLFPEIRDEL